MLSGRDKAKLQAKGFRIFYLVLHERCIKEQVNGSYRVHSRHNNYRELLATMKALMADPMNIEV